ncbi:MAG TPA: hypothetical protein VFT53_03495 [Candidatus Saccharimonadales bacterium]|nr:hypothetical protein [Candidatus Saccharimonadales bacterium]
MLSPSKQPPAVALAQLRSIAAAVSFPATRREIILSAWAMSYPQAVTNLLRRFPKGALFDCAADFIARCEDIELLQHEEQEAPEEFLRSP